MKADKRCSGTGASKQWACSRRSVEDSADSRGRMALVTSGGVTGEGGAGLSNQGYADGY